MQTRTLLRLNKLFTHIVQTKQQETTRQKFLLQANIFQHSTHAPQNITQANISDIILANTAYAPQNITQANISDIILANTAYALQNITQTDILNTLLANSTHAPRNIMQTDILNTLLANSTHAPRNIAQAAISHMLFANSTHAPRNITQTNISDIILANSAYAPQNITQTDILNTLLANSTHAPRNITQTNISDIILANTAYAPQNITQTDILNTLLANSAYAPQNITQANISDIIFANTTYAPRNITQTDILNTLLANSAYASHNITQADISNVLSITNLVKAIQKHETHHTTASQIIALPQLVTKLIAQQRFFRQLTRKQIMRSAQARTMQAFIRRQRQRQMHRQIETSVKKNIYKTLQKWLPPTIHQTTIRKFWQSAIKAQDVTSHSRPQPSRASHDMLSAVTTLLQQEPIDITSQSMDAAIKAENQLLEAVYLTQNTLQDHFNTTIYSQSPQNQLEDLFYLINAGESMHPDIQNLLQNDILAVNTMVKPQNMARSLLYLTHSTTFPQTLAQDEIPAANAPMYLQNRPVAFTYANGETQPTESSGFLQNIRSAMLQAVAPPPVQFANSVLATKVLTNYTRLRRLIQQQTTDTAQSRTTQMHIRNLRQQQLNRQIRINIENKLQEALHSWLPHTTVQIRQFQKLLRMKQNRFAANHVEEHQHEHIVENHIHIINSQNIRPVLDSINDIPQSTQNSLVFAALPANAKPAQSDAQQDDARLAGQRILQEQAGNLHSSSNSNLPTTIKSITPPEEQPLTRTQLEQLLTQRRTEDIDVLTNTVIQRVERLLRLERHRIGQ